MYSIIDVEGRYARDDGKPEPSVGGFDLIYHGEKVVQKDRLSTYSSNEVIDMAIIIWVGGHVFLYALALGTIESVIKVVVLYIASLCLDVVDKPAIIGKGNRVSPLF